MAESVQLIKELLTMDVSIYEIMVVGVVFILAWRLPDLIKALREKA